MQCDVFVHFSVAAWKVGKPGGRIGSFGSTTPPFSLTDLGGHLVDRNVYQAYGELMVEQETSFGDRAGDGDVDATDEGTPGSTCTGTVSGACRILDLDFDGDYDSTDATLFDALPQGLAHHPGRLATNVDQPFGHQGLLFEPQIGSYQNRARQYDPAKRRFVQRDPMSYADGMGLYAHAASNPLAKSLGELRHCAKASTLTSPSVRFRPSLGTH